jgi:tetratricopeptide (TPR) repeat protein
MRKAIARALIVPILAIIPLISGCQSQAKKHLYAAEDLFEKRDLPGAQKELLLSIAADPKNPDAHKSLAHIDEFLGDQEGAAKEYSTASLLDPTDQKIMEKARFYKQLQELANSSGKALDDIKAGHADEGVRALRDILVNTKFKAAREKATKALVEALPIIEQQGDDQVKAGKFADAMATFEQGIHAAMMLGQTQGGKIPATADGMIKKIVDTAKQAKTPDEPFKLLNDLLGVDSENKAANMELAQVYLNRMPPDYDTAADLEERGGAPDDEVAKLRAMAKKHRKG